MSGTHLPDNWIQKLCVDLGITGWLNGVFPHQVVRLFTAWAQAEGGTATWNPLNATNHASDAFGAWQNADYNSIGVCNYKTPWRGIMVTAATLLEGPYAGIVAALRNAEGSGATAEQIVNANASEFRTWGTNPTTILAVLKTTP